MMFTGIIEEMGQITRIDQQSGVHQVSITAPEMIESLQPGASVAVDGTCLTVTNVGSDSFSVDVMGPTLKRTIAGDYEHAQWVNLERPVQVNGRLEGHIVQGHVDSTGQLLNSVKEGNCWIMEFSIHKDIYDLTVLYGSITINGVSLTVSQLEESCICRVGVIPFTFEKTNLGLLQEGKKVNVEGDLVGKYISKFYSERDG